MPDRVHDTQVVLRAHTTLVAAVVAGLSGFAIILSELNLEPANPWRAVITAMASSFLAVALVGVISDTYLKSSAARYMSNLVRLRDDLRDAGVVALGVNQQLNWQWTIEDARTISILVVDPFPWMTSNWQLVQAEASHRTVDIRVFFARPGTQACQE